MRGEGGRAGHVHGVGGARVGRGGVRSLAARSSSGRPAGGAPPLLVTGHAAPRSPRPVGRGSSASRPERGGRRRGPRVRRWDAGAGRQRTHAAADETDRVRGTPTRWSAVEEHAASPRALVRSDGPYPVGRTGGRQAGPGGTGHVLGGRRPNGREVRRHERGTRPWDRRGPPRPPVGRCVSGTALSERAVSLYRVSRRPRRAFRQLARGTSRADAVP